MPITLMTLIGYGLDRFIGEHKSTDTRKTSGSFKSCVFALSIIHEWDVLFPEKYMDQLLVIKVF